MDRVRRLGRSIALLSAVIAAPTALAVPAFAEESFKLGIVTFLSGPAEESFGVPARNGGQFVVEQLNKGAAPAPYDKVGFGGMKIEPVVIDENGGATKQVQSCATSMSGKTSMSSSALSAPAIVSRWRRLPKN